GLSYTADTLEALHRRSPESDWWLILGSDCLPDIPGWHEPARIVTAAGLLIVERQGSPVWPAAEFHARLGIALAQAIRYQLIPMPMIDIASRDIRDRVTQGRTIRYLVPRAVECYIESHRLYA